MNDEQEKRKNFNCPRNELLKTVKNEDASYQWPEGYGIRYYERDKLELDQLQIYKTRLKGKKKNFPLIGHITIGEINSNWSFIRTRSPKLFGFLDELVKIVSEYCHLKGESTAVETRRLGEIGRPHYPEDIWAWKQVNQHKRPPREVYPEWLEKIEAEANTKRNNMVLPKDQFRRIIKPEWRRK